MNSTTTSQDTKYSYDKYFKYIRDYPEIYLKDRLDIPYWHDGMRKMIKACQQGIRERKPVVIGSGHAQSKDYFVSGRLTFWFMEAYAPCVVIMTGPTERQVQSVMWGELQQAFHTRKEKEDNLPEPMKTIWKIREDWYCLPFTTKDTKDAIGKFQGFHSPRMMVVLSEAQAISDEVFDQIEGCVTGEIGLVVCLGNPLRATGRYAKMLKDPKNNIIVNLNCLDSPNVREKKVIIPGMSTYEWVEDKRRKWGEADPRWYGRVLGLVPPQGTNQVFPEDAMKRSQSRTPFWEVNKCVVSCDVATSGEDDAQIYGLKNGMIVAQKTISGSTDLRIIAQEMLVMKNDIGANCYAYDGNGVGDGLGVILRMVDPDKDVQILAMKGSESPVQTDQYQNRRAEDAFFARTQVMAGVVSLLPSDNGGVNDELFAELSTLEYFVNPRGRVQLEDKDDIKEKLGHSPNRADAWILGIKALDIAKPLKNRPEPEAYRAPKVSAQFKMMTNAMNKPTGWEQFGL